MTDINKPVAQPDETLVHLHFIKPRPDPGQVVVPASQSTWIGTSVSRGLHIADGRTILTATIDVGEAAEDSEPDDAVDITAVRTKLYNQGTEYLNMRHHYFKVMNQEAGLDKGAEKVELGTPGVVASWMYEALVSAGTFQWTLSAILRLLEQESPALAAKAAEIVDYVQDAGIEAIEDANDDLDPAVSEVPRRGKSVMAAFGDTPAVEYVVEPKCGTCGKTTHPTGLCPEWFE